MRRLFFALVSTVSVVALMQTASAADMGGPYKAPPPAPPPVQDWSGIYTGWEGGYGWGHESFDPAFNGEAVFFDWVTPVDGNGKVSLPSIDSIHQKGWLFGGFVGAQKQWGSWVLGIEADYDAASIKGSATSSVSENVQPCQCGSGPVTRSINLDSKIDGLGSVRSKTGWAFAPNWLAYLTSGVAYAHSKYTVTLSETDSYGETYTESAIGGASRLGWTLGAGLDWKWPVDAGSAWVFGVEYLHYGFPAHTVSVTDNLGAGSSIDLNSKLSVDTIKARISYLFSIH